MTKPRAAAKKIWIVAINSDTPRSDRQVFAGLVKPALTLEKGAFAWLLLLCIFKVCGPFRTLEGGYFAGVVGDSRSYDPQVFYLFFIIIFFLLK